MTEFYALRRTLRSAPVAYFDNIGAARAYNTKYFNDRYQVTTEWMHKV